MQDFKKKKSLTSEKFLDDYYSQVQFNSKKNIKITQLSNKKTISQSQQQSNINARLKYIAKTYAIGIALIINTALWYPISVKMVKRVFRLKGFINIHFGVLPILMHVNAFTLGIIQGCLNTIKFRQNYGLKDEEYKKIL